MARPIAYGVVAALATGAVWALLSAALGFHLGLLVLAAFGGWIIGSAVKSAGPKRRALAAILGAVAWFVGSVLDFVVSQAILPGAATSLATRVTAGAYLDYTSAQFDIIQIAAIAILVVVSWRSAR
jgi:predicted permease